MGEGKRDNFQESMNVGLMGRKWEEGVQVIPQLIARIDSPRRLVSKLIHSLLASVGKQHPQVCLCAVCVHAYVRTYVCCVHVRTCVCVWTVYQLGMA